MLKHTVNMMSIFLSIYEEGTFLTITPSLGVCFVISFLFNIFSTRLGTLVELNNIIIKHILLLTI